MRRDRKKQACSNEDEELAAAVVSFHPLRMKSWLSDTTAVVTTAGPKKQPYGVGWVSNGLQLKRTII